MPKALGQSIKIHKHQTEIQGFEDQLKQIQEQHEELGDYSHDIAFKVGANKHELSKRKLSFDVDAIDEVYNFWASNLFKGELEQ